MCYNESEIYPQHTNNIMSLMMNTNGRVHVKSSKEKENLHQLLHLYLDYEIWNDNLHDLHLPTIGDKSQASPMKSSTKLEVPMISPTSLSSYMMGSFQRQKLRLKNYDNL